MSGKLIIGVLICAGLPSLLIAESEVFEWELLESRKSKVTSETSNLIEVIDRPLGGQSQLKFLEKGTVSFILPQYPDDLGTYLVRMPIKLQAAGSTRLYINNLVVGLSLTGIDQKDAELIFNTPERIQGGEQWIHSGSYYSVDTETAQVASFVFLDYIFEVKQEGESQLLEVYLDLLDITGNLDIKNQDLSISVSCDQDAFIQVLESKIYKQVAVEKEEG